MTVWLERVASVAGVNNIRDMREISYTSGDAEVTSKGMTALHYAAFYAKRQVVETLLRAGAGMYRLHNEAEVSQRFINLVPAALG